MIGLWLEDQGLRLARDLPIPTPAAGEALIRVLAAGICGTDHELLRGYYPYAGVLGHEFVGIVERAPSATTLEGRRVCGEINAVCGTCVACAAGRGTHCERRTVLGIVGRHGAFAEYLTLPVDNLHVVPASVSDEAAVFVEPLAAALEIQEQVSIATADRVLVLGDGRLGQLIARTLALTGSRLTVAGRHDSKLRLLADLGIETVRVESPAADAGIVPDSGMPSAALRGFDIVVECTGNATGFELARSAIRPRGTLVMKSTYAHPLTLDVSALVVDEITLVGSRCGPFAPALELLESGRVTVTDLISEQYRLEDAIEAVECSCQPGVVKVLLRVAGPGMLWQGAEKLC